MPAMARLNDIGMGVALCPIPVPQAGILISGCGTCSTEQFSQSTTLSYIISGCGAVGVMVSSSSTGNSESLGIARMGDFFTGRFSGMLISGASTAVCGG